MEAKRPSLADHAREVPATALAGDIDVGTLGRYCGYGEQLQRWRRLEERGARASCIGHSVAETPLYALEVGNPAAPRVTAVLAGLHPIEWIGVEVLHALLWALARTPPRDRRVVCFPIINVDGYRQIEDDLRRGSHRWRRTNSRGVDLNRNWPTHFAARRRPWLWRHSWGGEHALSEPETAAVCAHLDGIAEAAAIDCALSLHSIGRMLLLPWGGRFRAPAAARQLHHAAEAVRGRLSANYRVRQTSHWLPGVRAKGIEIDHLHARYGALAMLVECTGGGARLRAPKSLLNPFRWYNPSTPASHASELAAALEPFVLGADSSA